jgi:hypothetical protein
MKRKMQSSLCFIAIIFLFACQKQTTENASKENLKEKIIAWLQNQKSPSQPNKAASIDLLAINLEFSKLTTEESHDGEQIIIIPLKEEFKRLKNISDNCIPVAVMKTTNEGNIRVGNVVLFIPSKGQTAIPKKTFYNIFYTTHPNCDGTFKFLDVTGTRLYELSYDNGNLFRIATISKQASESRTAGTCIDWYLITTYYYQDGTTSQTTEYVGTTCSGCDDGMNMGLCPMDGFGDNEEEYEYEKRNQIQWVVYRDLTVSTEVDAWDLLKGRNGSFTSYTAKGSMINWSSPYKWREDAHYGSVYQTAASATVKGTIINSNTGNALFPVETVKNWYYWDVFP